MICTKDGKCNVNPINERKNPRQWFEGYLRHNIRLDRLADINMDVIFLNLLKLYSSIKGKRNKILDRKPYNIVKLNCELHGCCLIFSPKFFEKMSGFDSRTFMYCEETILYYACINKVTIASGVLIAGNVLIEDHFHGDVSSSEADIEPNKRILKSRGEISIGENVWIGENVVIMPGVSIGRGCVIGANSTVTKSIPDYAVAAGSPAKIIRRLKN